ncbi:MAG: hypothetical protein HWE25_04350 [Alphaproteobacteria bacterium]|nr:hypothetical protein [Alphaproteobacteria bacterium]
MARPLPKDVEAKIAGTAKRSEIRSVGVWGFILGSIFGFALGGAAFGTTGGNLFFLAGAAVVASLWYLSARRSSASRKTNEKK